MDNIEILEVQNNEQLAEIKALFQGYAALVQKTVHGYSNGVLTDIPKLPGEYILPEGMLLLAFCDGKVAGCIGLRKLTSSTCEMRRLYVKPEFRAMGIGRKLALASIEKGQALGYSFMRLDTIPHFREAVALYEAMGFKRIERYNDVPLRDAIFMELDFTNAPSAAS